MQEDRQLGQLFEEAAGIMARLRGPGGCPWDREQTPETIRKYTLEETYEVLDAIERQDWVNLCEELGDLLLQVLFYAQMASEAGHFTLSDVLTGLNRKLVRRHPHVFGAEASAAAGNQAVDLVPIDPASSNGSTAVLSNWHAIKELENKAKVHPQLNATTPQDGSDPRTVLDADGQTTASYLAGVLRAQGALSEAAKLGAAAARAGFDWPNPQGLVDKVREEAAEVEAELATPNPVRELLKEEVGDLLFTAANLARHLKLDPEMTLRDANAKFRRRFEAMEQGSVRPLEQLTAAELEEAWARIKAVPAPRGGALVP